MRRTVCFASVFVDVLDGNERKIYIYAALRAQKWDALARNWKQK